MTADILRGFSRALCDALATRNTEPIEPFLHPDVEWVMYGPIDLFPFMGQRKGKAAVLATIGELAAACTLARCEPERVLFDGSDSAALVRLTARDHRSGRTLTVRMAQFASAENGQLRSVRVLFDTLDAAEQALGREFDLSQVA
ncbi:MAG: nuclear transport factor 2 family protein [Pseudolabrys sp.]